MYDNINREKIVEMSIAPTSNIRQAMRAIAAGALGTALLVEEGTDKFIGLVTDGDVRCALLKGKGLEFPVSKISRPEPRIGRVGMSSQEITNLLASPVRVLPILDRVNRVVDLVVSDKRIGLPVAEPTLGEKELAYVTECILTGWVSSSGEFVNRFEEMVANSCQSKFAIATSSGTTALHLALLSLGIGPGDEVIIPTLSFIATANAVTYTGANPVFVDSETETWNLSAEGFSEAVTAKTKAVIPVHLYGHSADMEPILKIAQQNNLSVIEDVAEAQGAHYKGRPVGSFGDVSIFSFYGNKIITTGEGGMVVTNRLDLAQKIRLLRDHGMSADCRYFHPVLGYNYRMTNLQAALGVAQMERIDKIIAAKKEMAYTYTGGLKNIPGIRVPAQANWANSVFWLYSILIDANKFGMTRDQLANWLKDKNIDTRPLFRPIHQQPVYRIDKVFPVAQQLSERGLSLPSSVNLSTGEIQRVITAIRAAHDGTRG